MDRELLATLLGLAGYSVREAATGEEALVLARTERPDLVITDIVMPTMNGYEFVRRLRTQPETAGTPVVFYTANYGVAEVKQLAAACGVSDFIGKPSDPKTIVRTVGEVLGSPRVLPPPVLRDEFDRAQLRLVNDKLVEKVGELEFANGSAGSCSASSSMRTRRSGGGSSRICTTTPSRRWWPCGCAWRRSPAVLLNPSWHAS